MFGLFGKPKVRVSFVNAETGKQFAVSHVPVENLPETFAEETVMHLGNENWAVLSAQPETAEVFRKTRKLTLVVEKRSETVSVDPGKLLYSLPTLNNELAGLDPAIKATDADWRLNADEWRNLEWVSQEFADKIEAELADIRHLHQYEAVPLGENMTAYRRLHVRKRLAVALTPDTVSKKSLCDVLGPLTQTSLTYYNAPHAVQEGFSLITPNGLVLYGQNSPSGLLALGLDATQLGKLHIEPLCENLDAFAHAHRLVLVDWCRAWQGTLQERSRLESR